MTAHAGAVGGSILVLLAGFGGPATAQAPDTNATAFIQWARTAARPLRTVEPNRDWSDLDPLGRAIGSARVVGLSEGVHLGHEPLAFRNRLIQYLVERHGFTAIAIESGISESRLPHRYAAGESVDRKAAIDSGFSWQFQYAPENVALLDWIRSYNGEAGHPTKIGFYGFDVPGSPGNVKAARRTQTGLDEALGYLDQVDPANAAGFRARLAPFLTLTRKTPIDEYAALADSTRDRITAAIADLIALLERRGPIYAAASAPDDYQWARRHAAGARQIDGWLRRIPVGFTRPAPGHAPVWFWDATDIRDRGQAENVRWILDRLGPQGRLLIYASGFHISAAALPQEGHPLGHSTSAGMHLRQALGTDLVTIGNLIGGGEWGCAQFVFPLPVRAEPSMDRWAGQVRSTPYYLDLRAAPQPVAGWLARSQPFGAGADAYRLEPSRAFDLVVYYDRVGPVCPPVAK